MSVSFDPTAPVVRVWVLITGPARSGVYRFALDTGATRTIVRPHALARLGFDPSAPAERLRMRSATGEAHGRLVTVRRLAALERERTDFPLVAHDLPPGVSVDGLLGLDFFRGMTLTVDFARGRIRLRPPRRWWRFWR